MAKEDGNFRKNPQNTNKGGRPKGATFKTILTEMLDNNAVETTIILTQEKDGIKKESTTSFGVRTADINSQDKTLKQAMASMAIVKAFTDPKRGFEYFKLIMERIEGTAPHSPPISDFEERVTAMVREGIFSEAEMVLIKGILEKFAY